MTSSATADPTRTTAGSHASPLVCRARSTNVELRAAQAVVPISVAASSTASSTSPTSWAWRWSRNAPPVDADTDQAATSAKTDVAERGRDALDDGVGQLVGGGDGEDAERLEVDEHVTPLGVDTELGEGDARGTDGAGGVGEELDRHRAGQRQPAPSPVPRRRQRGRAGQRQLDVAVGADPDDGDLGAGVEQRGGGGPHGDVDPQQPLAGVDDRSRRSVATSSGGGSGRRARGVERRSRKPAAGGEQRQHARGQQRRLADPDRRR